MHFRYIRLGKHCSSPNRRANQSKVPFVIKFYRQSSNGPFVGAGLIAKKRLRLTIFSTMRIHEGDCGEGSSTLARVYLHRGALPVHSTFYYINVSEWELNGNAFYSFFYAGKYIAYTVFT
jgi:hypothetical protein